MVVALLFDDDVRTGHDEECRLERSDSLHYMTGSNELDSEWPRTAGLNNVLIL